ncbi:unnamed protein product [Merluccius merluccius]
MKLGLDCSTLLYLAVCISNVYSTHGPVDYCDCPKVSDTKVNVRHIVDYKYQSSSTCGPRAVVFNTTSGARICADPTSKWTTRAIGKVNADRRAALQEVADEAGRGSGASMETRRPNTGTGKPSRGLKNRGKRCRKECRKRRKMHVLTTAATAMA